MCALKLPKRCDVIIEGPPMLETPTIEDEVTETKVGLICVFMSPFLQPPRPRIPWVYLCVTHFRTMSLVEWQSCVIGLLLFSIAFGLLGTILCTCGVCVESVYMKMYYFHSAAEVYFICGVCTLRVWYSSGVDTLEHLEHLLPRTLRNSCKSKF